MFGNIHPFCDSSVVNFDVSSSTSENKRLVSGLENQQNSQVLQPMCSTMMKFGSRSILKIGYAQERRILKLGTTSWKVRKEPLCKLYCMTLNMDEGVLRRPVRAHSWPGMAFYGLYSKIKLNKRAWINNGFVFNTI